MPISLKPVYYALTLLCLAIGVHPMSNADTLSQGTYTPEEQTQIDENLHEPEPFEKVTKSKADWKKELSPEAYRVMWEKGTERAFSGKLDKFYEPGVYRCASCGHKLFSSKTKFDSRTGWPSFWLPYATNSLAEAEDRTLFFLKRTEILCNRCGSHQGHVFDDGPRPTGLRYCINSVALTFEPETVPENKDKETD